MSTLKNPPLERRRAKRHPARDAITLWWTDHPLRTIQGHLVDKSKTGMRITHGCVALGQGQQVRFQHAGGEGIARTIWTRIVADSVESGLLILPEVHTSPRPNG